MIRRVHGSVLYLQPDTNYELKVILKRSDGSTYDTINATIKTWNEQFPFGQSTGKTLNVPSQYPTINAALDDANAGDKIVVAPGTYAQSIFISEARSGAQGSPVTISGYGATLSGVGFSQQAIYFLDNAHDVVTEGFKVIGREASSYVYFGNNVSNVVVQSINFDTTNMSYTGSVFFNEKDPTNVVIRNNTVKGNGMRYAMFFQGGKGIVISGNDLRIQGCEDIVAFRSGPHEEFDIYDNYFEGTPSDDGMELEGGVNINVRMWNNHVNNSAGSKATMSHTPVLVGPIYVFRNVFYGSLQSYKVASNRVVYFDFDTYSLADFGPVFYYHNTFFHPYTAAIGTDYPQIFRYPNRLCHSNTIWKNNIFYNRAHTSQVGLATTYDRETDVWGQVDHDYNLYYKSGVTSNPNESYNIDLHSLFTNPQFVSTSWPGPDLTLQSTSPAIDKGIVLPNINDNFTGEAPDLGAYEYGQESNRPPKLNPIGNKSVNVGSLLEFTVEATDPDGDRLSYSASNLPRGAKFNPDTQTFSWRPTSGQAGTYENIHFEVTDGVLTDSEDITITVALEGLSFAIDLSRVKAYPNPYRGDKHSQIIFDNLTVNVRIRIYTLTGELVKEIKEQEGDKAYWDVKNNHGERVSSGTYLYHITNPKGEEKKGKVAIIK